MYQVKPARHRNDAEYMSSIQTTEESKTNMQMAALNKRPSV